MLHTGCSLKYMHGVCKTITNGPKIHYRLLYRLSPFMCPHFYGLVHKSVDINQTQLSSAKLQTCRHIKILKLAACQGMVFSIMTQKIKMDDTYTYTCLFEHISSCSIAHMSTTRQSTNMCHWYIYMTAVNAPLSNLRKTSVLKLLQDKHQLLINKQKQVIVLTYSLTNPQNIINTVFFLKLQQCAF